MNVNPQVTDKWLSSDDRISKQSCKSIQELTTQGYVVSWERYTMTVSELHLGRGGHSSFLGVSGGVFMLAQSRHFSLVAGGAVWNIKCMTLVKLWLAQFHSSCRQGVADLCRICRVDTHLCPVPCLDQVLFVLNSFLKASISTLISS
jgi:hypothetical protein